MSRYRIEASVVDTANASESYSLPHSQGRYGNINHVLHRSRRGRWYLVHDHTWTEDHRNLDYAEWISPEEAARLLLANSHDLPNYPEMQGLADKIAE